MVDFRKRLGSGSTSKEVDPIKLYDTLDRASDKGPLRPAQIAVLQQWHDEFRTKRDVVIKLHTGQGKTLIGLLLLQSKLHETGEPALYLCANKFLASQTCEQAKQFGVLYCESDGELPTEFLNGSRILITTVPKLFNGFTKFGLGARSTQMGSVLLDDSHACVDLIRDAVTIELKRDDDKQAYWDLFNLFSDDLTKQGAGTFADIREGEYGVSLPVPYWAWNDRQAEVVAILKKHQEQESIRFCWPLLKDGLEACSCFVSGQKIEIAPLLPPLHRFGSFHSAKSRVFMSATVTNDAFLIRGLGLEPEVIKRPLTYKDETWSGEKMVLIPSLIHESLDRAFMVVYYGKGSTKRRSGVVVLAPSFNRTKDWEAAGATVAKKGSIEGDIKALRQGDYEKTLVIANRYDGIDLPDNACRTLILDSLPYSESLVDSYSDACRPGSEATRIRTARTIEQGLGRSVRGEKDFSVIVLLGAELVRTIRERVARTYLSDQTRAQVDIGLEIAAMATEEIDKGADPLDAWAKLVAQCVGRDEGWKSYYVEQMNAMKLTTGNFEVLDTFAQELAAEQLNEGGQPAKAAVVFQAMADQTTDLSEKGWYLQEAARCMYRSSVTDSNKIQIAAHRCNRGVMRPRSGMQFDRLLVVSQKRAERVGNWIRARGDFDGLLVVLDDILARLEFGTKADRFELALHELGQAIGFDGERPDREWKEGPDNLWGLKDDFYFVIECKSEVSLDRAAINKEEAGQLSNAKGWFDSKYPGAKAMPIMVIPTEKVGAGASLPEDTVIFRQREMRQLIAKTRSFFKEFQRFAFDDLDEKRIQGFINAHGLRAEDLQSLGKTPKSV